jgi:hypothetical protein
MKPIEAMRILTTMPTGAAKDQDVILSVCVDRSQRPRRHENNEDRECLHARDLKIPLHASPYELFSFIACSRPAATPARRLVVGKNALSMTTATEPAPLLL